MSKKPEPVYERQTERPVRINSRDVARKVRKEFPPETQVHIPKNAYRRERFNWRDAVESSSSED